MIWVAVILLAAATFALAAVVLRLPRGAWMLFGATLFFGLAGYAAQGSPGQAGSPKAALSRDGSAGGEALVRARREFFGEGLPARFVVTSDAFARKGQFADAADFLGNALQDNPNDVEAWVALGNALVEHAGGQLGPAALEAFRRGELAVPGHPAPTYFLGLAYLRQGEPDRTRELWLELLRSAPEDADWRLPLAYRLRELDRILGAVPSPRDDRPTDPR